MSWMALLTGYGPYYIIGFVITFFTLMSVRYLLGEDIYPQEKIVRITLISAGWLPCLIIAMIVTYVRRSDKLISAQDEADVLRQRLRDLQCETTAEEDLAQKEVFDAESQLEQAQAKQPEKKKGLFSW